VQHEVAYGASEQRVGVHVIAEKVDEAGDEEWEEELEVCRDFASAWKSEKAGGVVGVGC
jgi:hypothetical protein